MGARHGATLVAVVLVSMPASASAAELRWSAPSDCDFQATVREDAERLLGGPLEAIGSVDFEVAVTTEHANSWKLRLTVIERENGERRVRELTGASCSEVANAAAVAVAMAAQQRDEDAKELSSSEVAESPDAGEKIEERSEPPQSVPRQSPPFIDDSAPTRREEKLPTAPHLGLGAGLIADTGALPDLAPGAEIEVALHYQGLRLAAVGAAFATQHAEVAGGAGGDFRLLLAGALACWERRPPRSWSFVACGGYEIGSLEGEGTDIARSRLGSYLWQAVRADLGVGFEVSKGSHLELRVGGAVPLARREFVLNGDELVHRPDGLSGRAYLGADFEL